MKRIIFFILPVMICYSAVASDLEVALRDTYAKCVGIDEQLSQMKKMAGINTAVTGVGTGLGIGAVAVGIAKKNVDKDVEDLEIKLEGLRKAAHDKNLTAGQDFTSIMAQLGTVPEPDKGKWDELVEKYGGEEQIKNDEARLKELTTKSKSLGGWRTGLMAGTTATGVAGAVIASGNKVDASLEEQVQSCADSVAYLRRALATARIEGEDTFDAQEIVDACDGFQDVDLSVINKRATGATVSSIVTAATGVTGTIVSAVANSNKIRDDNSDAGRAKEKNLNTSSNVLAAGASVASATATIFNATQIAAIKKVVAVSEACSAALK